MLTALRDRTPEEAERLLAEVIQRLVPHPNEPALDIELDAVTASIVDEVRLKVGTTTDEARLSETKILDFLGSELANLQLAGGNEDAARGRLGNQGLLRPDHYRLRFTEQFADIAQPLGVTREHAAGAIRGADCIQHLAKVYNEAGQPRASLFTRWIENERRRDPFTLFVETWRTGDELEVNGAWRIYQRDVPHQPGEPPLELLELFVHRFGVEFSVLGTAPTLLMVDEAIPVPPGPPPPLLRVRRKSYVVSGLGRMSPLGVYQVGLFYAVALDAYLEALLAHGVQATLPRFRR